MRPSIRLGRFFGIDIGLHYSWLIIALGTPSGLVARGYNRTAVLCEHRCA